jgi:hypothetical protein
VLFSKFCRDISCDSFINLPKPMPSPFSSNLGVRLRQPPWRWALQDLVGINAGRGWTDFLSATKIPECSMTGDTTFASGNDARLFMFNHGREGIITGN